VRANEVMVAQERRWATPVAIAALLSVALFVASVIVGSSVSGEGEAELLRSVQQHGSDLTLSGAFDAIFFALLAFPLVYLFRVVKARAERMRAPLIGLLVLAPLCLAISTGFSIAAKKDAASSFTSGEAKSTLTSQEAGKECAGRLKDKGAKSFRDEFTPARGETALAACERKEIEDDEASNALSDASAAGFATFFGFVGAFSLIVGLFYTSLWAMRTGVLSRFWAALGMALGVTVLLGIVFFLLIWLVYVGLLIGGWVPGGRPPAWEAGEAIPWPTPGDKAAAAMESSPDENGIAPPELEEPENLPQLKEPRELEDPEETAGGEQSR
jgi:hypothetical protein